MPHSVRGGSEVGSRVKPVSPLQAWLGLFWAVGGVHWCRGFHARLCGAVRWCCRLCSSVVRETRVAFVGVVGAARETGIAFAGVVGAARETGVAFAGVVGPVLGLCGRALVSWVSCVSVSRRALVLWVSSRAALVEPSQRVPSTQR